MRQRHFAAAVVLVAFFTSSAVHAAKQYLWVTNAYGNDVHVIDVAKLKVVKRIVVGPQPHGIAAAKDASVVFVAVENFKGPVGELLWINPRTCEITHRLKVGPKPNQIACTPDGRWVYVPCNDGRYWVVDAKNRKVVTKIRTGGRPHNTLCSADGKHVYLSPMGSPRRVFIVDVAEHKVVGEIPYSNSVRPPALAADEKRHFQHVDGMIGFEVSDVAARKVVARVRHKVPKALQTKPSRCHGLAIRPDQKEIWSCNVEHRLVHVHDITKADYPEIATLPMIGRIYWLCFSPDSKYAFVSVRSAN
ncbi:MAG: hypothetical protein ACE5KM_19465, partial [Planctomycetaceae bacterium]